jgi:hypothetical protein
MAFQKCFEEENGQPKVLVAILAKQKAKFLPLYLKCLEQLDYRKSAIHLYIRTSNNTDTTTEILREWLDRRGHLYASVEFDTQDVPERVELYGVHEWNSMRFRVMGRLRDESLRKTVERDCQFYFAADADIFVRPQTLTRLMTLNLPIVAPLLRMISPSDPYSNFHAAVDATGYYKEVPHYHVLLHWRIRGIIEVPVVHCTYLVRADLVDRLSYRDGTERNEYVIFSDTARAQGITQYLDNRLTYGYILFDDVGDEVLQKRLSYVEELLGSTDA